MSVEASLQPPWVISGGPPDPISWVLLNVNIVDVKAGKMIEHAAIVIKGPRIVSIVRIRGGPDPAVHMDQIRRREYSVLAVGPAGSRRPSEIRFVDLSGTYVCPGLIDCHVHLSVVPGLQDGGLPRLASVTPARSLLRQPALCSSILARGFTTVRDCGGATAALKEALDQGVFPGPRVYFAGKALSQTGGHADLRAMHEDDSSGGVAAPGYAGGCSCGGHSNVFGRVCNGVPECLHAARDELRKGADFIKIMAGGGVMSPTDKLLGLQFTKEEIAAIVTTARNAGTYVTAHAYTNAATRLCIEAGVRGIEHGNLLDRDTLRLMAHRGVFLTPTLITYKMLATLGDEELGQESADKNRKVLETGLESVKVAGEEGVTMCYGSDLLGDLWQAQADGFALLSQVMSPAELLRTATVNAAKLLMEEDNLGQIAEGFLADLLILSDNPLEDISILDRLDQHLLAVMKNGVVHGSRIEYLRTRGVNLLSEEDDWTYSDETAIKVIRLSGKTPEEMMNPRKR